MQLKQKLSYVRDLTHADWTHSWKAEAVIGCDQPITCENGGCVHASIAEQGSVSLCPYHWVVSIFRR